MKIGQLFAMSQGNFGHSTEGKWLLLTLWYRFKKNLSLRKLSEFLLELEHMAFQVWVQQKLNSDLVLPGLIKLLDKPGMKVAYCI